MKKILAASLSSSLLLGCGSATGGGAGVDMSTGNAALNGCTEAMFVDLSGAGANRTIAYGGNLGLAYSPACAIIAVGQTINFAGDQTSHPLSPGSGPTLKNTGSPNNPIPTSPPAAALIAVTFPTAGNYPYFCQNHFNSGMVGLVRVR